MGFNKLPLNSENILLELVQSQNPTQALSAHYIGLSAKKKDELGGIVRELTKYGYINVKWADNIPYIVTLNNSARTYEEQLIEYEKQNATIMPQELKVKHMIFISHRSIDKEIADMLVDFFCGTGVARNTIFCSSLPGNDINEKISDEVKTALKGSAINIAILSHAYYQSAYCLNEAGVLWYEDVPVIPIALPEIDSTNMYGFLNNEYKLRRLDSDTDISYIYDAVCEALSIEQTKVSIVTHESKKLMTKYSAYINTRIQPVPPHVSSQVFSVSDITTDDERIILYYVLQMEVRKVTKEKVTQWLNENEIYHVNIDNAFDLLSSISGGSVNDGTLELGIESFRKYSANAASVLQELQECVDRHTKLSVDTFKEIWKSEMLDSATRLFVAYIIDEKMRSFGDRWMADAQIESIKLWENKNQLDSELSSNYGSCLGLFVQYDLVFESSWTSYGNPREYSLCPSLRKFLFDCPKEILEEAQNVKLLHNMELPF